MSTKIQLTIAYGMLAITSVIVVLLIAFPLFSDLASQDLNACNTFVTNLPVEVIVGSEEGVTTCLEFSSSVVTAWNLGENNISYNGGEIAPFTSATVKYVNLQAGNHILLYSSKVDESTDRVVCYLRKTLPPSQQIFLESCVE